MKIKNVENLNYEIMRGNDECDYPDIVFDTRRVTWGCLFICVKGANFDPHTKTEEIIKAGAAGLVTEHEVSIPDGFDVNLIRVGNTREALSYISAAYFDYPAKKLTTIAVTGTKGKTTTTAMIKKILETDGRSCGSIGTLGIHTGKINIPTVNTTPESYDIQRAFSEMVNEGCRYAVMEVSSQAVMMDRVAGIEYDYGIFTNISPDHIGEGEHKDFGEYLMYKTKLFEQVRHGFVNSDDEHAGYVLVEGGCPDMKTFGMNTKADFVYGDICFEQDKDFIGITFKAVLDKDRKEDGTEITVGLPGEFNAPNAMGAICVCKALGVRNEVLSNALKDIKVAGRMELVYSTEDLKVLIDFAHNEVSTENLLETLREYSPKRLVLVFGCGGNRSKERRYGMGRLAGEKADFSIITEDNSRLEPTEDIIADIHTEFDKTGGKFMDIPIREEAVFYAIENHKPGDLVAIIGKGHEDYIDKNGVKTHYTDGEAVEKCLRKLSLR